MVHNNIEDVAKHEGRLRSRKLIIPVFVPHMGCPHDCCFCNQRKISGRTEPPTYESVVAVIKEYSGIASNYGSVEVAFYGGSFTAIPWQEQENLLKAATEGCKILSSQPDFRVSTRPDYIDDEILERLKSYGVKTIELGVQSMEDEVLKLSGRGHLSQDTVKASGLIKRHGFVLGIQTMPGLPGTNRTTEIETARKVIALAPEIVRIYPTVVIRGTELEHMYLAGRYRPLETEEAVDICAELIPMYEEAGIKVIRTGLQSSDNISNDGDVVAGPYHPAFGELVRSRLALNLMTECITAAGKGGVVQKTFYGEKIEVSVTELQVTVVVPGKMLSQFIGQKRCNPKILREKTGIDNVVIKSV